MLVVSTSHATLSSGRCTVAVTRVENDRLGEVRQLVLRQHSGHEARVLGHRETDLQNDGVGADSIPDGCVDHSLSASHDSVQLRHDLACAIIYIVKQRQRSSFRA